MAPSHHQSFSLNEAISKNILLHLDTLLIWGFIEKELNLSITPALLVTRHPVAKLTVESLARKYIERFKYRLPPLVLMEERSETDMNERSYT